MAIKKSGPEVWAVCDKCTFSEFAGFDADKAQIMSLTRWGWVFGKRHICPECVKRGVNA